MGGGDRAHWDRVAPILTAIAADYHGTPCAAWLGPEGAGHFVKAVHNGIEYADMQMIAEIYGLMRDGLGRRANQIGTRPLRPGSRASPISHNTSLIRSVGRAVPGRSRRSTRRPIRASMSTWNFWSRSAGTATHPAAGLK